TCSVTSVPASTGSMPAACTVGAKIGVRMRITTIGSTNMQPMKNAMHMMTSTIIGSAASSCSRSLMSMVGTCANDSTHEKAAPAATRMNTTAVIMPVETASDG